CIAWAAEDTEHWWQPGVYWPLQPGAQNYDIAVLVEVFRALGYTDCGGEASLERGFLKVALYGDALLYTHAARQLPTGKWTSKLGKAEDIEHETPDDVGGGIYGDILQIMKRPVSISSDIS